MAMYSFRNFSRVSASRCSADFVIAFGVNATLEFGPSFRFGTVSSRSPGVAVPSEASSCTAGVFDFDLFDLGVVDAISPSSSPSSSSPKDNLPFATFFFFFLNAGCGVKALYLKSQHPRQSRGLRFNIPVARCCGARIAMRGFMLLAFLGFNYFCAALAKLRELHEAYVFRLQLVVGRGGLACEARK